MIGVLRNTEEEAMESEVSVMQFKDKYLESPEAKRGKEQNLPDSL